MATHTDAAGEPSRGPSSSDPASEHAPRRGDADGHEEGHAGGHDGGQGHGSGMYWRFGAMIATSTLVMFLLTYTNAFTWGHMRFSEERVYMALLMGGAMAIVMLGFMWGMYRDTRINVAILIGGLVLMGTALWLSRSQQFVDDTAYMSGMIPHHSIAILTSERADIDDVRVRQLADEIIRAQRREIDEMAWLIDDIERNGVAETAVEAEERPVPDFEGELNPTEEYDSDVTAPGG